MTKKNSPDSSEDVILGLTADIVASYIRKNELSAKEIPSLIQSVYSSLTSLGDANPAQATQQKPAVSIVKSISDEFIICLEDGKKLKMMKRYIRSRFGLSPDEYRQKWGLPADYPMVAPAYARKRSQFAKDIGLGKGVGRTRSA